MNPRNGILVGFVSAAAFLLSACGGSESLGPPTIRYGEATCEDCGMIVSDERYAAALLVTRPGEGVVPLVFDDIGDMLRYEVARPDLDIVKRYTHDHSTRAWLEAERAFYALARDLPTPMASGLAACADEASAQALAERHGGRVLDWETLRATFRPAGVGCAEPCGSDCGPACAWACGGACPPAP